MESILRLAFVSDIHGNLAALEAVIADLEQRQVDRVVNLGDTLSGPLLPQETAQRLRALEDENGKLKRLLADAMLDKAALNDLLSKKW